MAEVANLPQAPTSELSAATVDALAADIPKENLKNEVNDLSSGGQLGTSPVQEKSSNSHHHDSEYDTASDLEGGAHDDYDDDDDDDGDEDDEDDDSIGEAGNTDSDSVEFDAERQRGDGQEQSDYSKKVDEDRSNPQYIPKKGTFYEHDDRTADDPEVRQSQETETSEVGESKSTSPTTISQVASKTMKKWQPASGVDRWSHDRFDAGEQAPKSRTELVSAYGYDIRNEDGPPRARRRRRYARGPSKYSRNWEDETAYIKPNNVQRKPPKPEDFPALEERQKMRKSRSYRDEKENRFDRQQSDRVRVGVHQNSNRENKEHMRRSTGGNSKNFRTGGRQPAMEFKNKNRPSASTTSNLNANRGINNLDKDMSNIRLVVNQSTESNAETSNFQKGPNNNKTLNLQQTVTVTNQQAYNGYEHAPQSRQTAQMVNNTVASGFNARDTGDKFTNSHMNHNRQSVTNSNSPNLSARLQQAQNRNDPSHVGSVQMHTLANQHNTQPNQSPLQNSLLDLQQQQQVANQQEHARTKRYSSLRQRTQQDGTGGVSSNAHIDQHTLQQLQMQHEVQQQQQQQVPANIHPPQQLMLQEQHLIQANLMQLYHQENLNLSMQALQVSGIPQTPSPQQPAAGKQPYAAIQQQFAAGTSGPPTTAYYATAAPDFSSPPPAAAPPPSQYTQSSAFMQTQSAAAPLAFNSATTQPLTQAAMTAPVAASPSAQVPPGTVNYVQTASQNPTAATAGAYPNYPNYQNFNTVGGTTYFVPSPQPAARPVVLPQRRPTNAIPILPPSEKTKRAQDKEDESKNAATSGVPTNAAGSSTASAPIGSAENIDHILDNMFVQRPPYQPQTRKSASPPSEDTNKVSTTSLSAIQDPVSSGKPRQHESSANVTLPDIEPSTGKQSNVGETQNQNILSLVTPTSTTEALVEAPPIIESIGK